MSIYLAFGFLYSYSKFWQQKKSWKFRTFKEATTGFEPVIRVLQTHALPLGYVAIWLLRESNPCYRRERAMSWPLDQGALYVNTFSGVLTPPVGLEPTTTRLTAECSTDWAKEEYQVSCTLKTSYQILL